MSNCFLVVLSEEGNDKNDADLDPDNDGLNNLQEFKYKTHPLDADTDKDGVSDGKEISSGDKYSGLEAVTCIATCFSFSSSASAVLAITTAATLAFE